MTGCGKFVRESEPVEGIESIDRRFGGQAMVGPARFELATS